MLDTDAPVGTDQHTGVVRQPITGDTLGDAARQPQQPVGFAAHGRHHHQVLADVVVSPGRCDAGLREVVTVRTEHCVDVVVAQACCQLVGQAVCDLIDERHQAILPERLWGDGDPEGVRQRAAAEMMDTARAAARFGVGVVNGFTGSSIWHLLYSFPPVSDAMVDKITTIRRSNLRDRTGRASASQMVEIERAMLVLLGVAG